VGDNAKNPIAVKQTTSGAIFIDLTSLSIALERGSTALVGPFAKPLDPPRQRPCQALLPPDKHDHVLTFVNLKYELLLTMSGSASPHPRPEGLLWGT
jgi:hypothetical protein